MLSQTRRLICYDMVEIEFPETKKGELTGKSIKKIKYSFFDRNLKCFQGYTDKPVYKDRVRDMSEMKWDDTNAFDYLFKIVVFDGEQTEQLIAPAQTSVDNP